MKSISIFLFSLMVSIGFAQIPANYYSGTEGLTKEALKSKLSSIISAGHRDRDYKNLYIGYQSTDSDFFYENDGSLLDMYSENPSGVDSYTYHHGQNQCGTYAKEGDCYNREHIVPQSLFKKKAPMRNDIHFVVPSDGKVNGVRGSFPFGEVAFPEYTSKNGSKLGKNTSTGFSKKVFEPIDEFKGDIARMIFYFVTRYESQLSGFDSGDILSGSAYPGITKWQLNVLLKWHKQDPVSQRERDRNNAAFVYQGNRNPFIDNPNWVSAIWEGTSSTPPTPPSTPDTTPPSIPTNLKVAHTTNNNISVNWTASTDNIGVTSYDVCLDGVVKSSVTTTSAIITGLMADTSYKVTIIAKDAANNKSKPSEEVIAKTKKATSPSPQNSCGKEDFENIPNSDTSYKNRTWTNNNITWTATDARTDQSINGKAIMIRTGSLTSPKVSNGIGSLKITTKLSFNKDTNGTLILNINGRDVGSIPYSFNEKTTVIDNINIAGDVVITIKNNKNRVIIDDLSWTCYSPSSRTNNVVINSKKLSISPNPVKNNEFYIGGLEENKTFNAVIYSINGNLVQRIKNVKNNSKISLKLPTGVYIVKVGKQSTKLIIQ